MLSSVFMLRQWIHVSIVIGKKMYNIILHAQISRKVSPDCEDTRLPPSGC